MVYLEDPSRLGALTRDWLDLATRLDETSYFQTPDWILSWWETIADRPETRLATWRASSGRLEALVVLSRDRESLHRKLPIRLPVYTNAGSGVGAADHCGWLVAAERRDEVGAWVTEAIGGGDLLLRGADPGWGPPPIPAAGRVVEETVCPRLSLQGSHHDVGPSAAFRRQLRRLSRRLEEKGVEFEWLPVGAVDERVLAALFELHGRRRARRGKDTSFGLEQFALHAGLTRRSDVGRGPVAVVARCDSAVVGVLYGFSWKDVFAAYQIGWEAQWDRYSMGSVLISQALGIAAANGVRIFDFLRGTEPYKYRFGAVDRRDRTWLVPQRPAGMVLAARYRVRQRAHPRTPSSGERHVGFENLTSDRDRRCLKQKRWRQRTTPRMWIEERNTHAQDEAAVFAGVPARGRALVAQRIALDQRVGGGVGLLGDGTAQLAAAALGRRR